MLDVIDVDLERLSDRYSRDRLYYLFKSRLW
jgi:hypothetical protein